MSCSTFSSIVPWKMYYILQNLALNVHLSCYIESWTLGNKLKKNSFSDRLKGHFKVITVQLLKLFHPVAFPLVITATLIMLQYVSFHTDINLSRCFHFGNNLYGHFKVI